jgi:hypothetical protein
VTDILLDPNDTGEIQRPAHLGDDPTRNLAQYVTSETAILSYASLNGLRRPDATGEIPVVTDLKPSSPPGQPPRPAPSGPVPHPPPPPQYADSGLVQPLFPPARVIDAAPTEVVSLLGALGAEPGRPIEPVEPKGYVGRHRDPLNVHAVAGAGQWRLLPKPSRMAWARVSRPVRGFAQLIVIIVVASALLWWWAS